MELIKTPKPSHKAKLIATHSVEEIIPYLRVKNTRRIMTANGNEIQITRTLKLFRNKGTKCVVCGMVGIVFKEWQVDDTKFLCLYGIKEFNGKKRYVLMTADHIVPKCLGGLDNFNNLQPMCSECNNRKGGSITRTDSYFLIGQRIIEPKSVHGVIWVDGILGE